MTFFELETVVQLLIFIEPGFPTNIIIIIIIAIVTLFILIIMLMVSLFSILF